MTPLCQASKRRHPAALQRLRLFSEQSFMRLGHTHDARKCCALAAGFLCRPFRALTARFPLPRAHALGSAAPPLWGFQGRAMLSPERAGQQSPGREPWVENRRSQALKGRHRTHLWFGTAIGSIFEAEAAEKSQRPRRFYGRTTANQPTLCDLWLFSAASALGFYYPDYKQALGRRYFSPVRGNNADFVCALFMIPASRLAVFRFLPAISTRSASSVARSYTSIGSAG